MSSGLSGSIPINAIQPLTSHISNISCARGTFEKMHKNCDAMDNIAFRLEDLNDDGKWIPELTDYDDPESLLIAQQTLHQLQDLLGEAELSVLLGDLTMGDYCSITGISRRSFFRRLSRSKQLFEELLGSDVV